MDFNRNYVHLYVNVYVPTCELNLLNHFFKNINYFLDRPQIKIVSMVEERDQQYRGIIPTKKQTFLNKNSYSKLINFQTLFLHILIA